MLDPVLLRTFLVVAQGNSFSATARKLAMRQSTVSDHVRRLETHLGRQLFARDTHSVALTSDGEALIGYAELMLGTCERAEAYFAGTRRRGTLRLGANEDLLATFLPGVLQAFGREHPDTDLELTVGLTTMLMRRFDAGDLDLVVCKRWPDDDRGELVWRDRLAWVGRARDDGRANDDGRAHDDGRAMVPDGDPLPLVLYPSPSLTRSIALAALSRAETPWRQACTSDTLSGLVTATKAGLGVMVLARSLVPSGLAALPPHPALPELGALDFVLLRRARSPQAPVAELAAAVMSRSRTFGRATA